MHDWRSACIAVASNRTVKKKKNHAWNNCIKNPVYLKDSACERYHKQEAIYMRACKRGRICPGKLFFLPTERKQEFEKKRKKDLQLNRINDKKDKTDNHRV